MNLSIRIGIKPERLLVQCISGEWVVTAHTENGQGWFIGFSFPAKKDAEDLAYFLGNRYGIAVLVSEDDRTAAERFNAIAQVPA